MISETYNMDCMDYMRDLSDDAFELAIVDPPYGISGSQFFVNRQSSVRQRSGKQMTVLQNSYIRSEWDANRPDLEYFEELRRVSVNQIIWGGNYFADMLPASMGWIVWDKVNGTTMQADCELAWTSFHRALRKAEIMWNGMQQGYNGTAHGDKRKNEKRIHPTQKPASLYRWILKNYANEGDSILDTHLGSGSSRIACHDMGFNFVGVELDSDYFGLQEERFAKHCLQPKMFHV